jgi:hypothetical protein
MGAAGEDKSDDRVQLPEVASDGKRPAGSPKQVEPPPADPAHNAKNLGSWAKRTGYKSAYPDSGEMNPPAAGPHRPPPGAVMGTLGNLTVKPAANPPLVTPKVASLQPTKAPLGPGPMPGRDLESGHVPAQSAAAPSATGAPGPFIPGRRGHESLNVSGVQSSAGTSGPLRIEPLRMDRNMYKDSGEMDNMSQSQADDEYLASKHSHMKYEIREHPGLGKCAHHPFWFQGVVRFLSLCFPENSRRSSFKFCIGALFSEPVSTFCQRFVSMS